MAFNDLNADLIKVTQWLRDKVTNKNLAEVVERRYRALIRSYSSLMSSATTLSSRAAITAQMDAVRAYFKRAMSSDPLAGNMYDPVRHVQTSEALMSINNQILTFAAQLGASLDDPSAPQESPTVTTPPAGPIAIPTATNTQRRQHRRQYSIPPRRQRDNQPPTTPKDASAASGPDPIAESAAKDNERFLRCMMNLVEEPNKTAQVAEQCFDLTHNAQGGTIRMPNPSHDEAIYRELYELIKRKRGFVRRLQETFMKVNQIITKVQNEQNLLQTCGIHLYQLDDPKAHSWVCVLPDDAKTMNELINHLVEYKLFDSEGDVYIFLRKSHAHELTPKGRLWELTDGSLNLRFHDPGRMDKAEYEGGALVLDWVVNKNNFAIALMDNGKEEIGSVLDIPKPDSSLNKCVREYLGTCLAEGREDLSGYEIVDINDIEKPGDKTVAEKAFHHRNFSPAKHSLVVKLRTRI